MLIIDKATNFIHDIFIYTISQCRSIESPEPLVPDYFFQFQTDTYHIRQGKKIDNILLKKNHYLNGPL
jgi:hypothetical protein